jgi:hypothetical protein
LITHHCKVVLCKEIPDQIDNTYMGIYAGISSDNIRNLHIVLADSPEPVENAAGVLCKRWLHAQARPSRVLLAIGSSVIDGSIQVQLAVSSVA